jgi:hypothetical protein
VERPLLGAEPVTLAFESICRGIAKLRVSHEQLDVCKLRFVRCVAAHRK